MAIRYEIGATHPVSGLNHTVEIDDSLFSGSSAALKGYGDGPPVQLTPQVLNPRARQQDPIQKSELTMSFLVMTDAHQTFVDDVLGANESRFLCTYKIDGNVEWKGYILPDLTEYPEESAPYLHVTFKAKDLSTLSKDEFPNEDVRETIITTIGQILSSTGYNLPIVTYTSWIEQNSNSGQDFLRQIYHDTKNLIDINQNDEDVQETQITNLEALRRILLSYGANLTLAGGKWRIWQESAFEDPTSVLVTNYDASGTFVSQDTEDVTYAPSTITIASTNTVNPAYKQVSNRFLHRSQTRHPKLPEFVSIDGGSEESFSYQITYSGEEVINLSARVVATSNTNAGRAEAKLMARAGQYYWDGNEWSTDTAARVTIPMIGGGVQNSDGQYTYVGQLDIATDLIPSDATSPLAFEFDNALIKATPDETPINTLYSGIELDITNLITEDENSESIEFSLKQNEEYTATYRHPDTYFGDGPTVASASALRYSSATADITSNTWQRRGSTAWRGFHENLLREVIDTNRVPCQLMSGVIKSGYQWAPVISHDGTYFLNLGGPIDAYSGVWSPLLKRIIVQTASDTLVKIIRDRLGGAAGGTGNYVNQSIVDLKDLFTIENAVGRLTADASGSVTSLSVELFEPVYSDNDYYVVNVNQITSQDKDSGFYRISPSDAGGVNTEYGTGVSSLSIASATVDAPSGSYIIPVSGMNARLVFSLQTDLTSTQSDVTTNANSVLTLQSSVGDNATAISGLESSVTVLEGDAGAIIRQASQPTTRKSGEALVAGDIWVDSDDDDAAYVWDGSAWQEYDGKIKTNVAGIKNTVDQYEAQSLIYAKSGGGIAFININSSETEGTNITISADMVSINGVTFDETAGTVTSSNFDATAKTGWRLTGGASSKLEISDVDLWNGAFDITKNDGINIIASDPAVNLDTPEAERTIGFLDDDDNSIFYMTAVQEKLGVGTDEGYLRSTGRMTLKSSLGITLEGTVNLGDGSDVEYKGEELDARFGGNFSGSWSDLSDRPFHTLTAAHFDVTSNALEIDATLKSNWDTAYTQRASQVAGTGLSWDGLDLNVDSVPNSALENDSITVSAGAGLGGGGSVSLGGSVTISMDQPDTITTGTSNQATTSGHTHELDITAGDIGALAASSNLSDVGSASSARANLDLGSSDNVRFGRVFVNTPVDTTFRMEIATGGGDFRVRSDNGNVQLPAHVFIGGDSHAADHVENSDERVKDIFERGNGLDMVNTMHLTRFRKEGMDKIQWGLIAQEVQQAHPDLVGHAQHKKYGDILTLSPLSIASVAADAVRRLHEKVKRLEAMHGATE